MSRSTRGHLLTLRQDGRVDLQLLVTDRLPVGRADEGLVVLDERVSRRHCEFNVDGDHLTVRDCGSSNGTIVDGTRCNGRAALAPGSVVTVGGATFEVGPSVDVDAPEATRPEHRRTVLGGAPAPSGEPRTVVDDRRQDDQLRASIVGSTLTLVFSDIIDSTVLVHQLGDQHWLDVLRRHDEISRSLIARFDGTAVKGQGDGFLMTFPSARHALLFAMELQRSFERLRGTDPDFPVHVRIGVHTGEVLHSSGDVFGRHVHLAARVAGLAGQDEIVASALVRELADPMGDLRFGPAEAAQLKGFDGTRSVHRVMWREDPVTGTADPS